MTSFILNRDKKVAAQAFFQTHIDIKNKIDRKKYTNDNKEKEDIVSMHWKFMQKPNG